MTTPATDEKLLRARAGNPFSNLLFGLRVWAGEVKWLLIALLRGFERRQMRRRLTEELASLGRWTAEAAHDAEGETMPLPRGDALLTLKQIRFLRDELALLDAERDQMRKEFNTKRSQRLGV